MPSDPPGTASTVTVLSQPKPVRMADEWFDIATLDHFWIKRRFEVCRKLLAKFPVRTSAVAEIGSGHGVVQRQFEDEWSVEVDGFDLNMRALAESLSRQSKRYYYDVLEQRPEFQARYDLIVLFDVLEHIERDRDFLKAIPFYLKESGRLLLNVPASMRLFSRYDIVAGHVRRYRHADLAALAGDCGLHLTDWTYWGLPWYPALMLRKMVLRKTPPSAVIAAGFSPRHPLVNSIMQWASRAEPIPQHVGGTSLMALITR